MVVHGGEFQHPNHLVRKATEMLNLHHNTLQKPGGEESSTMDGEM
jgi:hypothetical protein